MIKPSYSVPYVRLDQAASEIKKELMAAFETVLDSGQYILGPQVSDFEEAFAQRCQVKYATGVANGTCSLHLVLRGIGLDEGDEVITAPNSFIASAATIALVGARPIFVDINPDLNMDPSLIEAAITPRTKAIIPVHLTGRPAPMVEIMDIAKRHDLFVLEDAAQAIDAKLHGKPVGSWGHAACFSLHPLKNLRAIGDGGMMTTNDQSIFDRMMKARNHGLSSRDQCDFWSFNCRLDEVQAAMLQVQLQHMDRWTEERRQLAFRYNELLAPYVDVPIEGPDEYCVYQTYMVQAEHRDALQRHLGENGVQALVHYPTPLHLQPAAKNLGYKAEGFPVTMRASARILSLPLYPGLTHSQQDKVAELTAEFYAGNVE
jgi:dTDP-4-amino-4,6-dideoxygalactose transaminase